MLGRRKDRVISALTTSVPTPFDVAEHDVRLCGIAVRVDPASGKALSVERVRVDEDAATS